jgi:molecular chaperone GrpE
MHRMKKAESHAHKPEKTAETPTAATEPAAANLPVAAELTPEQLEDLKARAAKADEHWDRLLRIAADLENFKKRAARERVEAAQSAGTALIQKLLPILDHLEMAQAAVQTADPSRPPAWSKPGEDGSETKAEADPFASLQAGVAMIQQQLKSVLAESGLEEIDARGKPFDPTWQAAVSQQETADVPEGHVVQQLRKGYKLRDRLLRPAAVIVAKKPPGENPKLDGKSEAVK